MTSFSYADDSMPLLQRGLVRSIEVLTGQPVLARLYRDMQRCGVDREDFWSGAVRAAPPRRALRGAPSGGMAVHRPGRRGRQPPLRRAGRHRAGLAGQPRSPRFPDPDERCPVSCAGGPALAVAGRLLRVPARPCRPTSRRAGPRTSTSRRAGSSWFSLRAACRLRLTGSVGCRPRTLHGSPSWRNWCSGTGHR